MSQSGFNRIGNFTSIDSFELVNNCTLAPSYSEAILICNINNNNNNNNNSVTGLNNPPVNLVSDVTNQDDQTDSMDHSKVSGDSLAIQMSGSNINGQSCSRTSLINGQFVYLPRPLGHGQSNVVHLDDPSTCLISNPSLFCEETNNNNNDNTNQANPPTYEEAITECRPLLTTMRPLNRSITVDRDFFRRLSNQIRQPWGSLTNFLGLSHARSSASINLTNERNAVEL